MPNHVHGIVVIDRPVETLHCNVSTQQEMTQRHPTQPEMTQRHPPSDVTQRQFMSEISPKTGSLGSIMRSYKSAVTRWCRENNFDHFYWQPRFYDHIIRADGSLDRIRKYIINNPAKWGKHKDNPANLWM